MALVNCEYCGKQIEKTNYQLRKWEHHFCNNDCRRAWVATKDKIHCVCAWCGAEFDRKKSQVLGKDNVFCSSKCMGKWRSENLRGSNSYRYKEKVVATCDQCGQNFLVHESKLKWWQDGKQKNIFCSKQCRYNWDKEHFLKENNPNYSGGHLIKCIWCDNEFWATPYEIKRNATYCSEKCKHEHFSVVLSKTKEWSQIRRGIAVKSMSKMKSKNTKPERMVKEYLMNKEIKFIEQHPMYEKFVVDFFLPDTNSIIEVNGDFWHGHPDKYGNDEGKTKLYKVQVKNMKKDKLKKDGLESKGHKVYMVWESDIYNNIEKALSFLSD